MSATHFRLTGTESPHPMECAKKGKNVRFNPRLLFVDRSKGKETAEAQAKHLDFQLQQYKRDL